MRLAKDVDLQVLFNAVCAVESNFDPYATGDGGRAVGIAQIWPVVVLDVNRICGRKTYGLSDRWLVGRSWEMFRTYLTHYGGEGADYERLARIWNGGPTGWRKASTDAYWQRVRRELDRINTIIHL